MASPRVRFADLGHDRDLDIALHSAPSVVVAPPNEQLSLIINNGRGEFPPQNNLPLINGSPTASSPMVIDDLGNDGSSDLVVSRSGYGVITLRGPAESALRDLKSNFVLDLCESRL